MTYIIQFHDDTDHHKDMKHLHLLLLFNFKPEQS